MMLVHSVRIWDEKLAFQKEWLASRCFSTSDMHKHKKQTSFCVHLGGASIYWKKSITEATSCVKSVTKTTEEVFVSRVLFIKHPRFVAAHDLLWPYAVTGRVTDPLNWSGPELQPLGRWVAWKQSCNKRQHGQQAQCILTWHNGRVIYLNLSGWFIGHLLYWSSPHPPTSPRWTICSPSSCSLLGVQLGLAVKEV